MSSCITGMPANTQSTEKESMRSARWVGFVRVTGLKQAIEISPNFLQVELIIMATPLKTFSLFNVCGAALNERY